jgi:hypothetical protein
MEITIYREEENIVTASFPLSKIAHLKERQIGMTENILQSLVDRSIDCCY